MKRLPKPYSDDELRAILAFAEHGPEKALVVFLLETGMRAAEALSITREEVFEWPFDSKVYRRGKQHPFGATRIIGKGDKERTVVLTPEAIAAGRTLAVIRPPLNDNGREEMMIPWTDRGMRYVLSKIGERAGVKCHAHRFRHTWVTQLVEAGNPIQTVADMAGHESVDTTRLYFLLSERSKIEAMERRQRWLMENASITRRTSGAG